ncbi:MAG TPA: hypothetical protein VLH08_05355 [Acidobacteriota bacterium]|nr:hypothetical protein [Acidobacteriota bacterium]
MKKRLTAALFLLATAAFLPAIENQRKEKTETIPLISEEIIEPHKEGVPDPDANRVSNVKRVRSHRYVDEITYARLKDEAYNSLTLPQGRFIPYLDKRKLQASAAPIVLKRFDGLNFFHDPGFPPDTIVAAGPNHLLQATNSGIRLSSKENTNVQILLTTAFFNRPNKFLFDPKVYFDRISNRFFALILEFDDSPQTSIIHLAVSRSAAPQSLSSGWCRYQINGKAGATAADFPGLGMNENWLAVTANNFRFSDDFFDRSIIKVVNKSALVNNTSSCPSIRIFSYSNPDSFTIQPSLHYTTNTLSGTPLFLVSTIFGNNNEYELWRVKGPMNAKPTLTKTIVRGANYSIPPNAKHKGSGVLFDTGDNRMLHSVFRNGSLWNTFSTGCSFGATPNESCMHVVQIIPTESSGTIGFDGAFGGGANRFFWMPSIAVNQNNDLVMAFQQSSPGIFLGTAFTGKRSNLNRFEPFRVARPGGCNLSDVDEGGRNRTGDYTGAHTDSDDISFWIGGEFPSIQNNRCEWNTVIARVRYN